MSIKPTNLAGSSAKALAAALPAPDRPKTIPERIADDLGVAIVDGELADGQRVLEEELAAHYGTSRSPVREAIGILERRGLLRTTPRRGTYVVGHSLDIIADLFNVRGVLIALAGRYMARRGDAEALAELKQRVTELRRAAADITTTPLVYARMSAATSDAICRHCGAEYVGRMLNDHAKGTSWGMIWRKRALDFQTAQRRKAHAKDFSRLAELVAGGADQEAEQLLRRMMFDSRDRVLASLVETRGGSVDPIHCLNDLETVPASG